MGHKTLRLPQNIGKAPIKGLSPRLSVPFIWLATTQMRLFVLTLNPTWVIFFLHSWISAVYGRNFILAACAPWDS
jgi:hypothetical protein